MSEKRLPDLPTRMRRRRSQLGLTGTELAQRAGISTSYVSLIETGAKVPEEDVAAEPRPSARRRRGTLPRLGAGGAAWGPRPRSPQRARGDLPDAGLSDLVESGEELPRLEAPVRAARFRVPEADLAMRLREVASRLGPEALAARRPRPAVGPGRRRRIDDSPRWLDPGPRRRGRPGRRRGAPPRRGPADPRPAPRRRARRQRALRLRGHARRDEAPAGRGRSRRPGGVPAPGRRDARPDLRDPHREGDRPRREPW